MNARRIPLSLRAHPATRRDPFPKASNKFWGPALIPLLLLSLLLPSCKWVKGLFAEKRPPFDPCDPYYDYYEKGKHFIHDRMVLEDGTIDYRRIFKGLDPDYTRCDPLGDRKPSEAPRKSIPPETVPGH